MHVNSLTRQTHPSITHDDRERIGTELQAVLVELIDLSLIGKQAHWSVEGPNFHAVHLQLDEFVDSWRALSDEVAERAVALGIAPNGQAEPVAAATVIELFPVGPLRDHDVVDGMAERLDDVIARTRARMAAVADRDTVSEDLLIRVVAALEQQRWMLKAQA